MKQAYEAIHAKELVAKLASLLGGIIDSNPEFSLPRGETWIGRVELPLHRWAGLKFYWGFDDKAQMQIELSTQHEADRYAQRVNETDFVGSENLKLKPGIMVPLTRPPVNVSQDIQKLLLPGYGDYLIKMEQVVMREERLDILKMDALNRLARSAGANSAPTHPTPGHFTCQLHETSALVRMINEYGDVDLDLRRVSHDNAERILSILAK